MDISKKQIDYKEANVITKKLQEILEQDVVGDVVEFGCYEGVTSIVIAKLLVDTGKKFYVYDSFEGLPEKSDQDTSPIGLNFKPGELSASKTKFVYNIKKAKVPMPIIHKAWFLDLTENDVPRQISFAFLDSDYYLSIKASIKLIERNLSKGAVVVVDDYNNEALPGVRKAVEEWQRTKGYRIQVQNSLAIIHVL